MWGPILEKAWAKVKGNYEASEGGFTPNGIRSITGAPVFIYMTQDITDQSQAFDLLTAANDIDYPMQAGTWGSDDSQRTTCGIASAHAYSILETFLLNYNGEQIKMLLMRNPWGETYYSGPWSSDDSRWTDELVA